MAETVRDSMRTKRFGDLVFEVRRAARARQRWINALNDAVRDNTTPAVRQAIRAQLAADPDFNEDWITVGQAALDELMERPEPVLGSSAVPMSGGRSTEATPESEVPNP